MEAFIRNTQSGPKPGDLVLMPNFVEEMPGLSDFVRAAPSSQRPQKMHRTPICGACTVCKEAGTVDLPADFDAATGDAMMNGRIVKVYCPRCRRTTEFRPLNPKELSENQFSLMRRYYELYKQLLIDGQEIPFEVKQFIDAYEEKLREIKAALGLKDAVPRPEPKKIVVPDSEKKVPA